MIIKGVDFEFNQLSTEENGYGESFRLSKRNVIDIVQYFILDGPLPFKSHEHLMHMIVNLLTDNTNVKLTPKIGPRNSRYFYCIKGK